MKKYLLNISIFLLGTTLLMAQQSYQVEPSVVSTTGGSADVGSYNVTWTVGETIIATQGANNVIFTQGFNQPKKKDDGTDNSIPGDNCGLEVLSEMICDPFNQFYQLLFTFAGAEAGDMYGLTNNQTGTSFVFEASSFTTEAFEAGTGYSFTVFLASDPDCSINIESMVGDCMTTAVSLLSFDGKVEEDGNRLDWSTASESNSDFFTLERSKDGRIFTPIAQLESAHNSNVIKSYTYLDKEGKASGDYYYRLLETNLDGLRKVVSQVVHLQGRSNAFELLAAYPIPSNDFLSVELNVPESEELEVSIYNTLGQVIEVRQWDARKGNNTFSLNVAHYAAGTYFLKASSTRYESINLSFVKED